MHPNDLLKRSAQYAAPYCYRNQFHREQAAAGLGFDAKAIWARQGVRWGGGRSDEAIRWRNASVWDSVAEGHYKCLTRNHNI